MFLPEFKWIGVPRPRPVLVRMVCTIECLIKQVDTHVIQLQSIYFSSQQNPV